LKPEYTEGTLKFGGGKIQVWGIFNAKGVGPIKRLDGIMTKDKYHGVLALHNYAISMEGSRKTDE